MLRTSPSFDILQDFDEAATTLDFLGCSVAADTDLANSSLEFELTELPFEEAAPETQATSADAYASPSQEGDAGPRPSGQPNRKRNAAASERNKLHQRTFRDRQRVPYDAVFADTWPTFQRLFAPVPTLVSLQLKWQHLHEELAAQACHVRQLQSENERLQSENEALSQPVVARGGSREQLCPVPVKQVGLGTHHLYNMLSQSQISLSCFSEVSHNAHCHQGCSWALLDHSTLLLPPPSCVSTSLTRPPFVCNCLQAQHRSYIVHPCFRYFPPLVRMQIMVRWTLANSVGFCAWRAPEKWKCTVHHTDEVISRHHAARMPPQQLGILWQVGSA